MKKLLAALLAAVLALSLGVVALAEGETSKGTIEPITDVGVVSGDNISVSKCTLKWYPADTTVGRYKDGWWVGVKIIAPNGYTSGAKYNSGSKNEDGSLIWKDFDAAKDGDYYIGCWVPVQPEYLEGALNANSVLQWTYQFKWGGDDDTLIQTFKITVDPNNITLNDKDGNVYCQTIDGVMVIKDGEEVPAVYTAVDAAVKKAAGIDLSKYTQESVAALNAAVKAVVPGLRIDKQATVDGYAADIEAAIRNLTRIVYRDTVTIEIGGDKEENKVVIGDGKEENPNTGAPVFVAVTIGAVAAAR